MAPVSGQAGVAMARLDTQCQELAAAPGTPLAPPKLQGAGEVLLGEPQGPLAMPGMVMQVWGWRPPAQPLNSQHRCVAGDLGTSGHESPLASGGSDPAQHKQLGPRVPSCSLWCPSTHFCIQQSPARHIIGTAWKIICHWGGGSRG